MDAATPMPPPRIVTLVLVDHAGSVLGALAPFVAATPWWMDMGPVVEAVRDRDGIDVTVLRLLHAERPSAHGGAVTYLAEVDRLVDRDFPGLVPWDGSLDDHPLRLPFARVGGPTADLAWATEVLAGRGEAVTGRADQIRTWNLSSLWRLPTTSGRAWLKVVPPFFAHEGRLLEQLAGAPVPTVLGQDGGRTLLADIPGEDRYDAPLPERLAMIDLLVAMQRPWLGRVAELLALGLPDWRGPALTAAIASVVDRAGTAALSRTDQTKIEAFIRGLPDRWRAIEACGLPDGLVHGDVHPGNVRGDGQHLVLLDWGDSGVGHPLLDQPAFLAVTPEAERTETRRHWAAAWQRAVPGSDPDHAAELLRPVAAARQAVIYQRFLDGIEPSEHPYHAADVPAWLQRTAAMLA